MDSKWCSEDYGRIRLHERCHPRVKPYDWTRDDTHRGELCRCDWNIGNHRGLWAVQRLVDYRKLSSLRVLSVNGADAHTDWYRTVDGDDLDSVHNLRDRHRLGAHGNLESRQFTYQRSEGLDKSWRYYASDLGSCGK